MPLHENICSLKHSLGRRAIGDYNRQNIIYYVAHGTSNIAIALKHANGFTNSLAGHIYSGVPSGTSIMGTFVVDTSVVDKQFSSANKP